MVRPPRRQRPPRLAGDDRGYAMVAMLIALALMSIMLTVAMPAWSTEARREKEAELVFRGEQYARALALFSRRAANASPPSIDVLVEQKFLRKKYKDPITGGDFEVLTPGSVIEGSTTAPGQRGASPTTQTGGRGRASTTGSGTSTGRGLSITSSQSSSTSGRGSTAVSSLAGMTVGANGGVTGVRSKSKDKSLRIYNGAEYYNQWIFVARQSGAAGAGGAGGAAGPQPAQGGRGQGGRGQRGGGSSLQQSSPFGSTTTGRSGSQPVTPRK